MGGGLLWEEDKYCRSYGEWETKEQVFSLSFLDFRTLLGATPWRPLCLWKAFQRHQWHRALKARDTSGKCTGQKACT